MNRPLRILYLLNSPGGGATQGIVELLEGLPREQYEAYVVVPYPPNDGQHKVFSRLAVETRVVHTATWNMANNRSLWDQLYIAGAGLVRTGTHLRPVARLCHHIRTWEIDLAYTCTGLEVDGALAARLCGVPHVWHIKEWIGQQARVRYLLPDPLLVRFFVALSNRVLVMSHFIGELFERYGLTDKLTVVNDGVDLRKFTGELGGLCLRHRLGVADGEILVGMAAGVTSIWKQHALFIEMASRLAPLFPHVKFAVFGPEPAYHRNPVYNRAWDYYQDLKRQVNEARLGERFIWAGFCPNIPQMMDAMDVLVHPCDIEPFGRVAIEAMAAQRPVVGPNQGGIAESVIDGETGFLVPPGDVAAFADATARLIVDADLRRWMGAAGRAHVAAHFSLEKHVQQVTDIYEQVYSAGQNRPVARDTRG